MTKDAKPVSVLSLNEELLERGLAKLSLDAAKLSLAKQMTEAQDRAKSQGVGVWKTGR